eukprot:2763669-Rhodomonas_salina.1
MRCRRRITLVVQSFIRQTQSLPVGGCAHGGTTGRSAYLCRHVATAVHLRVGAVQKSAACVGRAEVVAVCGTTARCSTPLLPSRSSPQPEAGRAVGAQGLEAGTP